MNDTAWKSWRTRALASILSIALMMGITTAGAASAFAQTPDDPVSQSELVDEGGQEPPQPEDVGPEGESTPDPGTEEVTPDEAAEAEASTEVPVEEEPGEALPGSEQGPAADDTRLAASGRATPPPSYTCDVSPQWLNNGKINGTVLGYDDPARTGEFIKVPVSIGTLDIVQVSMGAGENTAYSTNSFGNRPWPGHGGLLYTVTSLGAHTLYLDRGGNVWGLGLNQYGQVGDGTTSNRNTPVKVLGPAADALYRINEKVTRISAGGNHSVAVTESGKLFQWGYASELGIAGTAIRTPVEKPVAGATFKDVAAGSLFTMALSSDGRVFTWGQNTVSQLGQGANDYALHPTPQAITHTNGSLITGVTKISAGAEHGLASTGTRVYGWGDGVLSGNGVTDGGHKPPPQPRPFTIVALDGKTIRQIEATSDNSYVLTNDTLFAWGSREWGLSMMPAQWAGVGTGVHYTPRAGDLPAGLRGSDITGVFGGKGRSYITTVNDEVYAWGNNRRADFVSDIGDLGTEQHFWDFPYLEVPAKVPGLSGKGITQIAGGGRSNTLAFPFMATSIIAYTDDGASYGWGGNQVGQLGSIQADDVNTYVPYQLDIGATAPVTDGTVYFGDPALGTGVDKSVGVPVTAADIRNDGGRDYFFVKIPEHVVGNAKVHTSWGGAVGVSPQIGCYQYQLQLLIKSDPVTQTAGGDVQVTAYVPDAEKHLTGNALVDISIPAVGTGLQLVAGQQLTGLSFSTAGEVTTKVKLSDPLPLATEANGDWKYPDSAVAWIPSAPGMTSLAGDPNGLVASSDATAPNPWVWFTPPAKHEVHLWKIGESGTSTVVGMSGSEWRIYPDSKVTPNTPDTTQMIAGFTTEVTNPNTTAPERQKGWFTAELEEGVYWLVETKAPQGFSLMAESVQFAVSASGTVQAQIGRSAYFLSSIDWNLASTDETTLVVRDPAATPLPESGSEPWQWILVLGIVLLGATALLVVRRFFPDRLTKISMPWATP